MASAIELAASAHKLISAGENPRLYKLEKKQATRKRDLATFETVARTWHAHATGVHEWSSDYSHKVLRMLELHVFPRLGKSSIAHLPVNEVHSTLHAISISGTRETAVRLRESVARIYAFAVICRCFNGSNTCCGPAASYWPTTCTRPRPRCSRSSAISTRIRACRARRSISNRDSNSRS